MKVILCDNSHKDKWDEFVSQNSSDFGLLQSWGWGVFQESLGWKVLRLAVMDGDKIKGVAQIIKRPLKLGKSYFYIPRGPVGSQDKNIINLILEEIKSLAKKEESVFLRIDPSWTSGQAVLESLGFKFFGEVQPKQTLILDLSLSEEELLKQMKSKTRYNIKVAQKHGIEIDEGNNYFEDFWAIMEKTTERDQFSAHPKSYYGKMLESLGDSAQLWVAKYKGKVITANIIIFKNNFCVYLHGASDYNNRNKMAPFLLQWEIILKAKKDGYKHYDFWGVSEKKWPGVTRFKKGFAPKREFTNYIGAWDEVYSKFWYNIYKIIRYLKSKK